MHSRDHQKDHCKDSQSLLFVKGVEGVSFIVEIWKHSLFKVPHLQIRQPLS